MKRLLFAIGLLLLPLSGARAGILPLVFDVQAEGAFWWENADSVPAGTFDSLLFEAGAQGDMRWISPHHTPARGTLSRVFRRPDITVNNARSLAGLYDASAVLIGSLTLLEEGEVPWLGLRWASVHLEGIVVDVASGATLSVVSLTRTSHTEEGAREQATAAIAHSVIELGLSLTRPLADAGGDTHEVVVIRSRGGAEPFVASRRAIRGAHAGIIDVMEVWATEGQVALMLLLDDDTRFEDVARNILRLEGVSLEGARIWQASMNDGALWLDVESDGVSGGEAGGI